MESSRRRIRLTSPPKMTDQQRFAVERSHGLVCVEAGAGAGKTSVIAERYLRLVAGDGLLPGQILTITYTRKAAQEMKRRIIDGLARDGLQRLRRDVENGYIHTIHGFCERLLRENPFDAGVDPAFPILEEGEAMRMKERAFQLATAEALSSPGLLHDLVAGGSALAEGYGSPREILATLRGQVDRLLDELRNFGYQPDQLAEWAHGAEGEVDRANERALSLLAESVLSDLGALLRDTADPTLSEAWRRIALIQRDDMPTWHAAMEERLRELQSLLGAKLTQDGRNVLQKVRATARDATTRLTLALDAREKLAAQRSAGMLRLALLMWRHYDVLKGLEGQLDFGDLELRAVSLLEECEPIATKYQTKFRQILVDEFQDVNPLQAKLVRLISGGDNVCFVGDPRQAIFGFRFADVEQFVQWSGEAREAAQNDPEAACHVPLEVNFRSRPEILSFVAAVMDRSARGEFGALSASRDKHSSEMPPVEIWLSDDETARADAKAVARGIASIMADPDVRIDDRGILRPPRWGDFAILLRNFTRVEDYQRTLFAAGIPNHIAMAGRNFYARYEVHDMRNVLQALVRPTDELALACLLRSPMVGLSMDALTLLTVRKDRGQVFEAVLAPDTELPPEDEAKRKRFLEWFPDLSRYVDRRTVGEVIEEVLRKTDYPAKLLCRDEGPQQLANVRKLHQIALGSRNVTIDQFVRRLDRLEKIYQREGDAPMHDDSSDTVRLTTVHSAKGLEFPIVIVANTSARTPQRTDIFMVDPKARQIGCRLEEYESVIYATIRNRKREAELREEWRLLYVAMTRARDYLILTIPVKLKGSRKESWAGGLREALAIRSRVEGGLRELLGAPYMVRTFDILEGL